MRVENVSFNKGLVQFGSYRLPRRCPKSNRTRQQESIFDALANHTIHTRPGDAKPTEGGFVRPEDVDKLIATVGIYGKKRRR
ncbi:MAG: hypothetical protein PHC64_02365 [Candidatus Gastranaerophilales bacterium]|nr:hypothetical protein [Candidatus Gastranaerophilales bacterium]